MGPIGPAVALKGPAARATLVGPDGSAISAVADAGGVAAAPVAAGVVSAAVAPAVVAAAPALALGPAGTVINGPSGIIATAGHPYGLIAPGAIVAPGWGLGHTLWGR